MSIPAPLPTDAEDVSWALSTALTLWNRDERADAVVWVKRASKAAALADDDDRAIDLARIAAALSDALEVAPAPPPTMEIDVEIDDAPPSMLPLDDADFVDAPAPAKPPPRKPPPPPRAKLSASPPAVEEAMSVPPASAFDSLEPVSLSPPSGGAPASAPIASPPPTSARQAEPAPVAPVQAIPPPSAADDDDEGPLLASVPSAPLAYSLRSSSETVPGGFGSHPVPAQPPSESKRKAAITLDGDLLDDGPPPDARPRPPSAPRQRVSVQPAPAPLPGAESPFRADPPPAPPAETNMIDTPAPPVAQAEVASMPPPPKVASTPPPPPAGTSAKPPPPRPPKPPPPRSASGSIAGPLLSRVAAFTGRPDLAGLAEAVDLPDEAREDLEASATVLLLGAGATHAGFGLAVVIDGAVDVARPGGEACTRLTAGRSLRARSSIGDAPAVQLVGTPEGANLATWTPQQIDDALRACPWVEAELAALSDAAHAVAGATAGAMSRHLDAALRSALVSSMSVRAVAEGEIVAAPGETVPGVFVPGVGSLELFSEDRAFGSVGPGEFLYAMDVLGGAKAQRGARGGVGGALVLFAERKAVQDLILRFPPLLNLLTMV